MKSTKARKQRKSYFNAPLHQRRKQFAAHLEENLLLKYDRRRIPVVKGDTVRVMRGSFKGHEDKISDVHLKKHSVNVEGVVITKADGKKVAKPIHPSNLMITKLNLTDSWRRNILEKDLSEETKKEIEKEATDQIHELEEQKRKAEEEAAAAEDEESEEGDEELEGPAESEESDKQEENVAEKTSEIKDEKVTQKKTAESSKEKKTDSKKPSSEKQQSTTKKTKEKSSAPPKKSNEKKTETKKPATSEKSGEKKKEERS